MNTIVKRNLLDESHVKSTTVTIGDRAAFEPVKVNVGTYTYSIQRKLSGSSPNGTVGSISLYFNDRHGTVRFYFYTDIKKFEAAIKRVQYKYDTQRQTHCPVCNRTNVRDDYDYPKTMQCCDDCGADFMRDGEIILDPRLVL